MENFSVCDEVIPTNFESGLEVVLVEVFKKILVAVIDYPRLNAIEKNGQYISFVDVFFCNSP